MSAPLAELQRLLYGFEERARLMDVEDRALEAGEHNDYELRDEAHGDIADLLLEHAPTLFLLAQRLKVLEGAVAAFDAAEEPDDGLGEAVRVAARELLS